MPPWRNFGEQRKGRVVLFVLNWTKGPSKGPFAFSYLCVPSQPPHERIAILPIYPRSPGVRKEHRCTRVHWADFVHLAVHSSGFGGGLAGGLYSASLFLQRIRDQRGTVHRVLVQKPAFGGFNQFLFQRGIVCAQNRTGKPKSGFGIPDPRFAHYSALAPPGVVQKRGAGSDQFAAGRCAG